MQTEEKVSESSVSVVQGGILKADNEAQQSWSLAHRRDIRESMRQAVEELEAFPGAAERAYYSIPYKDDNAVGGKTMVEGPSIKAATSLMRNWKNCTSGSLIVGETDERVQILGFFFDVENNIRKFKPTNVSKLAWNRKTQSSYRLPDHRLVMAIQAGASKAERNAILSGLPQGMIDYYIETAKRIAATGAKGVAQKPVGERLTAMRDRFASLGVTGEQIDVYLDSKAAELNSPEKVLAHMIGVFNAISDGQTTPEEVFSVEEKSKEKVAGQTSIDDVIREAPKKTTKG